MAIKKPIAEPVIEPEKTNLKETEMDYFAFFAMQLMNDSLNQARRLNDAANAAAITAINVHSRCGQTIDSRVACYDVEDATAQTRVDPISQPYHMAQGISNQNAVRFDLELALEALKLVKVSQPAK